MKLTSVNRLDGRQLQLVCFLFYIHVSLSVYSVVWFHLFRLNSHIHYSFDDIPPLYDGHSSNRSFSDHSTFFQNTNSKFYQNQFLPIARQVDAYKHTTKIIIPHPQSENKSIWYKNEYFYLNFKPVGLASVRQRSNNSNKGLFLATVDRPRTPCQPSRVLFSFAGGHLQPLCPPFPLPQTAHPFLLRVDQRNISGWFAIDFLNIHQNHEWVFVQSKTNDERWWWWWQVDLSVVGSVTERRQSWQTFAEGEKVALHRKRTLRSAAADAKTEDTMTTWQPILGDQGKFAAVKHSVTGPSA